jgi:hypothetical protein
MPNVQSRIVVDGTESDAIMDVTLIVTGSTEEIVVVDFIFVRLDIPMPIISVFDAAVSNVVTSF